MTNTGIYCVPMELLYSDTIFHEGNKANVGLNKQVNVGKNENIYIFNKVNVHLHLLWIVKFAKPV
jgi:hypothetical protein